jgi:ELWxxDGT repeat protein
MPPSPTAARRRRFLRAGATGVLSATLLATTGLTAAAGDPGSTPYYLTPLGSRVLFVADDGTSGTELWATNGTTTAMVKEIGPGSAGAGPNEVTRAGSYVFFSAYDGTTGLWRTNGTGGGTIRLGDQTPLNPPVAVGSRIYFASAATGTGTELYTSDGTVSGTKRLTDLREGDPSGISELTMARFGTKVAFPGIGSDGAHDLWLSGPTVGSAKRVKDFGANVIIDWIGNANGTLYVSILRSPGKYELWKSDGTRNGTVLVKSLPGYAHVPTTAGSVVYFVVTTDAAGEELWRSKGTRATTGMVKDIASGSTSSNPENLTAVGSRLFFVATSAGDRELWRSNGSKTGTVRVRNINPSGSSDPVALTSVAGVLHFFAQDGTSGFEPWRSDGTKAGTRLIKDVRPGGPGSFVCADCRFAKLGTRVYFSADDGVHGAELWRTTSTGARLWANIRPD